MYVWIVSSSLTTLPAFMWLPHASAENIRKFCCPDFVTGITDDITVTDYEADGCDNNHNLQAVLECVCKKGSS